MFLASFLLLKHSASIPFWLEMAFLQKFMKRKSASEKVNKEVFEPHEEVVDHEEVLDTELKQTTETDSGSESDGDCQKEAMLGEMGHQLKSMNKNYERRRRRRSDVIAMEAEIQELISMTARCHMQCAALDEEILNKKCEIKYLQSEGPDDHEMHLLVKKSQAVLYKKYNNIKGSNEAKSLLTTIRQNQRALQYLELMTYNRYLERQHGIHLDTVQKRTNLLLKNKTKHFGHLTEALQAKRLTLKRPEPRSSSPVQGSVEVSNSSETTHVTVASSPTSPPANTHAFTFGFPMLTMPQDSGFGSAMNNSDRPRIPISPFETSL